MANNKVKKNIKSKGSTKKKPAGASKTNTLDTRHWNTAQVAWNKDGNLVILEPRLAKFLREKAREDREIELGIPGEPVEMRKGSGSAGSTSFDPFPLGGGTTTSGRRPPRPLELCVCDYLRFHLVKEGPVQHAPLSSRPLGT